MDMFASMFFVIVGAVPTGEYKDTQMWVEIVDSRAKCDARVKEINKDKMRLATCKEARDLDYDTWRNRRGRLNI